MKLLVVITMAVTLPALAGDWTSFRDPGGAFTVDFPEPPEANNDKADNPADGFKLGMHELVVDHTAISFMVITSDLDRYAQADAGKVLDGAAEGSAEGSKVISTEPVTVDGHAGRAEVMVDKDNNRVSSRIFFVGGRLYQVLVTSDPTATDAQRGEGQRFQDSFHFLK